MARLPSDLHPFLVDLFANIPPFPLPRDEEWPDSERAIWHKHADVVFDMLFGHPGRPPTSFRPDEPGPKRGRFQ